MNQETKSRAASFLKAASWTYLVLSVAMIALAIYALKSETVSLTFGGVTDAVFAIISGLLGVVAGIFGLVSKNLKRCRLIGLILFAIAAVPLIINLLAGDTFALYWKNLVAIVLPFLYLLASLLKRSVKKPALAEPTIQQAARADDSKYAASAKKPVAAPQPQVLITPEPQPLQPKEP